MGKKNTRRATRAVEEMTEAQGRAERRVKALESELIRLYRHEKDAAEVRRSDRDDLTRKYPALRR